MQRTPALESLAVSRQAWLVVTVLFVVLVVSSGTRSAFGVFLHPLLEQLDANRAAVSLAFTINSIVFGLVQPLVGRSVDRHGVRVVVLPAAALMALGLASLAVIRELWQLYILYGVIFGLGLAGTNTAVAFPLAVRWVRQRRGPVLGVLAAAGMVGSFVVVPGSMLLLLGIGWQGMLVVLAGLAIAVALPVLILPDHPPSGPVRSAVDTASVPRGTVGFADLVRSRSFWLLALPSGFSGFSGTLVQVHFVPLLLDHGAAPQFAANAFGMISALGVVAVLATGFVVERIGFKRVLIGIYLVRASGLLLVPLVSHPLVLAAVIGLVGLSWGGIQPATSGVAGDVFGRRHLGTVLGWIFLVQNILGATAAVFGGAVFDWLQSYDPAFLLNGVLLVIGGSMTAAISTPSAAKEAVR
jgi:MFS family permease